MTTLSINQVNKEIKQKSKLLEIIQSDDFQDKLRRLDICWETRNVSQSSDLLSIFSEYKYIAHESNRPKLTDLGILFLSRICIDFETAVKNIKIIDDKYKIIKVIQIGKNSATFLAEHVVLTNRVVLKLLRPGASENITEALKLISGDIPVTNLVQPIDYFVLNIKDIFDKTLNIECIVFPYINGTSLKEFLNNPNNPLNAPVVSSFIKQVGSVLAYLEKIGAYHGDLHEENIIVNLDNSGTLSFNVIDVSYGVTGSLSSSICQDNDMIYFRQHIWKILSIQQSYLAKMSIRKYLGSEMFFVVASVMSPETISFRKIISLFDNNPEYKRYIEKKQQFIYEKFSPPAFFKLQRYEEITDPTVALKLFVPFQELMDNIKAFSNIFISGNRGSGKSTYLAALAFFPKIDNPVIDYKEIFGVYFPCRQGEFRLLSSETITYSKNGYARVKHVLILKIIRRMLESLAEGVESKKLTEPHDYRKLKEQLSLFINNEEIMSLGKDIVSEIRNLVSIVVRVEMKELDKLFDPEKNMEQKNRSSEVDLLKFFITIRESFIELSNAKFHLLFDDAGDPNIPLEAQKIINDLILSSNPVYCVKLSIEKYSFDFQTTTSKQLENGHDFIEYDIPSLFFTGSKTTGLDQDKLELYCKEIVEKRLKYFDYQDHNIVSYVGDDKAKSQNLINSLAAGRRNAYYCGWTMIWKIADRTPRNLLEIVSEIFSVGNITKKSIPEIIPNRDQDRAIRSVSEKRLRSLAQISGKLNIHGSSVSIGRRVFEITSAIGSTYRIYLKSEAGKKRKDQYLAIERNDFSELSKESDFLLKELIKYGVFDESRLEFARDDRIKKPIYVLNRVYCPAFGIGLRRDQHLRLSVGKVEQLLLEPIKFVSDGSKRLRDNTVDNDPSIGDLFENFNDE